MTIIDYNDRAMAHLALSILYRMTGDDCRLVLIRYGLRDFFWRIIRFDPTGKLVRQD